MNDAFALPFRLGDRRKSFLLLDWHCSSGLKALFRREKKTAQQAIYHDPRFGSRASTSTSASFQPKSIAIYTTRTIASPATRLFPWQLGVRKYTDLQDCTSHAASWLPVHTSLTRRVLFSSVSLSSFSCSRSITPSLSLSLSLSLSVSLVVRFCESLSDLPSDLRFLSLFFFFSCLFLNRFPIYIFIHQKKRKQKKKKPRG